MPEVLQSYLKFQVDSARFQHLSQDSIEKSPENEYLPKTTCILVILLQVLNTFQLLADNVFK